MKTLDVDLTHFRIHNGEESEKGKIVATFTTSFPELGMEIRSWRLRRQPDGRLVTIPPDSLTKHGPVLSTVVIKQGHRLANYLLNEATKLYERATEVKHG